jgi:hypothetical protein
MGSEKSVISLDDRVSGTILTGLPEKTEWLYLEIRFVQADSGVGI